MFSRVKGGQIGLGRVGQRGGKIGLGQAQQGKAAPFADIGVERVGQRGRGGKAPRHSALQHGPGQIAAHGIFELGFRQVVAVQRKAIGFAVKPAGGALKRGHLGDLGRHALIADRQADAVGLVVQCGAGDQALQGLLVQPDRIWPAAW